MPARNVQACQKHKSDLHRGTEQGILWFGASCECMFGGACERFYEIPSVINDCLRCSEWFLKEASYVKSSTDQDTLRIRRTVGDPSQTPQGPLRTLRVSQKRYQSRIPEHALHD